MSTMKDWESKTKHKDVQNAGFGLKEFQTALTW
jgi:hypothetical protein